MDGVARVARVVTNGFVQRNRSLRVLVLIVCDARDVIVDIDGHMAVDGVAVEVRPSVSELDVEVIFPGCLAFGHTIIGERMRERSAENETIRTVRLHDQLEHIKCAILAVIRRAGQRAAARRII